MTNVRSILAVVVAVCTFAAATSHAAEVAKADLRILGSGLEIERAVSTAVDVPVAVQTTFAGRTNEQAPSADGLSVVAELTGPGIVTPLTLTTRPGHRFMLPALHEPGEYSLQNVRLVSDKGEFLQQAVPSFTLVTVVEALRPTIRVRQLTADELRQRGISVDERNFDVYEYTFVFGVEQKFIEVPYPVIIDRRTHEIVPVPKVVPYVLPPLTVAKPPRFTPPVVIAGDLDFDPGPQDVPPPDKNSDKGTPRSAQIPMALVVPNGFGVLHQFFAVIVQVSNGAPAGSPITLDSVRATLDAPLAMRLSKSEPAVSLGAAVPVYDEKTGATFLVAGASGSSEFTVEALKAGTHTLTVDVRATYKQAGQQDFPLRGKLTTSVVVSDPRFHINFSHPDTVRADEDYTAYAFITNLGSQNQHVQLDTSFIPLCNGGWSLDNICRTEGEAKTSLDFAPGQMITVPYRLRSRITGHVYAAAGTADDEAIGVSVKLNMGVSASGIPLSPATLVMPYYAKFLDKSFVDANMQILGLGYSLATAPLNKFTAKFPRLITSDVFRRAQDIARAGQRVFIQRDSLNTPKAGETRDAMIHLSLDLLGNVERIDQLTTSPDLEEWEQFRRMEASGRRAAAATARQLEANGLAGKTPQQFVDDFSATTSHRSPFLFAYVHSAATAPELSVKGATSGGEVRVAAEAVSGWIRTLGWGELTRLDSANEKGQLALVGRWKENAVLTIVPTTTAFTVHLIYPDTANGQQLRSDFEITGATPGAPVRIAIDRGSRTLAVTGATASPVVNVVPQTALRVIAAAQDLNLDAGGHIVTLLTNRPIDGGSAATLRDKISLTTEVAQISYSITRSNKPGGELEVPGASIQEDGRIVSLSFDKTLSTNATYKIGISGVTDLVAGGAPFSASGVVPRVDNNAPGGLVYGRVLAGDRTPVVGVPVLLRSGGVPQWDVTIAGGRFLFEFVARNIDANPPIDGLYELQVKHDGKQADASGAVRLPGAVHQVDLVFTGKGGARGQVRYDDGAPLAGAKVTIASAQYHDVHTATTGADGRYSISGISVGPMTFAVADPDGRVTYAANAIRSAGELVEQDLVILRKAPPAGFGKVRVRVLRSDVADPAKAAVAGAMVGVGTQGYALANAETDARGEYTFHDVPAGLVSIIAADWAISRESAAAEVELRPDQTLEQTLTLRVRVASDAVAGLEGTIRRDDPASPNDRSKDVVVPGAVISIRNVPGTVTADAAGHYAFEDLPLNVSGRTLLVFDPATGRRGQFTIPHLVAGSNHFSALLSSAQPEGNATMRVRLFDAKGAPVSGYRVFSPGIPPEVFAARANGVYELANARVPSDIEVVAVPVALNGPYGSQAVSGRVRVDFHGQVGVTDLRLPGEGTIVVRLENERPCSTPPCYEQALGKVAVTYFDWSDEESQFTAVRHEKDADLTTGLVTFTRVPALQQTPIETVKHPAGHASATVQLTYDGDAANITLRLKSLGDVTGRVLTFDRQTPANGATVTLSGAPVRYPPVPSNPDGTFRFAAVAAKSEIRVVAEQTQNGIYRTGFVDARTPDGGGPVSGLSIIMREQSTVAGQVVDANNAPVPLAKYWLRELAWPHRDLGSPTDPYTADINGRFVISNVFAGPFRITAVAPDVQEERGTYEGTIAFEGDTSQSSIKLRIGGAGMATVSVTVLDPLKNFAAVPSAHVTLARGGNPFDLATTDANGVAYFNDVPADQTAYRVSAFSKLDGRASTSSTFTLAAGEVKRVTSTLDFLGFVSGRITDDESVPAGQPARGLPVTITSAYTQTQTRASADGDGKFEFRGVPEGPFRVVGFDELSGREARSPEGLFISSLVQEHKDLALKLERTATLTLNVFLPNDSGAAGTLAPLVEATIVQADQVSLNYAQEPLSAERSRYIRSGQGNELRFPKMLTGYPYKIWIRELGGEQRTLIIGGGFAPNQLAKTENAVLQSHGTVVVKVLDGAARPVGDARVTLNGKELFTPADGTITLPGVPFGFVSAQASKGSVAASAGGTLQSRTIPLTLTLSLGNSMAVKGKVEAEAGGVSVGTRVIVNISSSLLTSAEGGKRHLEVMTDANGEYEFFGIPVGNTVLDFLYYGPDDTTIGAARRVTVPDSTTGTMAIASVKLDATPPRILNIEPPPNATNVSPNAPIVITFSEPIADSFRTSEWFQLIATDNGAAVSGAAISGSLAIDGTFRITIVPPPSTNPAQKFPLKSNVLYRIVVPAGVKDLTGNPMKLTVGSSFTTVNYTEPAVVKVEPSDAAALAASTFRVKFNKPIDITSLQPGGAGALILQQLDAFKGSVVRTVPLSIIADPADATSVVAGIVGEQVAESSFYRLTISGTRDQQSPPNVQKEAKVVDYFSFDTKAPVVTIVSPVAAGEKLISGVSYTATITAVDEGTTTPSKDIALVDWFDGSGALLSRSTTAPFGYTFVAPAAQSSNTSFTLKASATDLSQRTSPTRASLTWEVAANSAPTDIAITNTPASAYPTGAVSTAVSFKDEGLAVTVTARLKGTALDGSAYDAVLGSKQVTRASTSVEFAPATFNWTVPLTLKDGAASIAVTVVDAVANSASATAAFDVLADTAVPELFTLLPATETRYSFGQTYTLELRVRDTQTGVAKVVFTYDGRTAEVTSGTTDASGIVTFRTNVVVPPKNADTRVKITATAHDGRGNTAATTTDVIYTRVADESIPKAAWITPLDGAALPAGQSNWLTTLRLRASDNVKVTAVRFESPALAAPVLLEAPKSGTSDIYEAKVALNMTAGSAFVITARISDGDPAHDVELPITIDPVAVDIAQAAQEFAISSQNVAEYRDKSVLVRGSGMKLHVTVPVVLKNLMILDGAFVSNPEETKLDVTVTDRLFVDGDSRIDVTGRGYLGAWVKRDDNASQNETSSGRTLGGRTDIGASSASASHAGLGAADEGVTNATYGSITEPSDFGSGGSGGATAAQPGGSGGGAVALRGATTEGALSRLVVAGAVRADGVTKSGVAESRAGAGGSVLLSARSVIFGAATRITANGGDHTAEVERTRGAGGGRVAVTATERFDVADSALQLQARGGRNNTTAEAATYVDGGAGTVFIKRPRSTNGELVVSAFDERFPASTHLTRGTPLTAPLTFDAITVGPRALARLDAAYSVPDAANVKVDATAVLLRPDQVPTVTVISTTPPANGTAIQRTTFTATYSAASDAGISSSVYALTPGAETPKFHASPTTLSPTTVTLLVPPTQPHGPASFTVRVTDRAGRTAVAPVTPLTIVANTPAKIDTFTITPAQPYATDTITVTAAASDDVAVTELALTSSIADTVITATPITNAGTRAASTTFTVKLPAGTPSLTVVTLTLRAADDFPGRPATTETRTFEVRKDSIAPVITIVKPAAAAQIGETQSFLVEATIVDAEVAVKRAFVTFDGNQVELNADPQRANVFTASLTAPSVDGVDPIAFTLKISALDFDNNRSDAERTISVVPVVDPNGPNVSWLCGGTGALYPNDYDATLRISAVGANTTNYVQKVEFRVGTQLIPATKNGATDEWSAPYKVTGNANDVVNVTAIATSVGNNVSTLTSSFTIVSGIAVRSGDTMNDGDLSRDNSTFIVYPGATFTIVGPHTLKDLIVLGGTVEQKHRSLAAADTLTVNRLFVGCGAKLDVTGLGYSARTTQGGVAGASGTAGGTHIGRGGVASGSRAGVAFGSVYAPREAGGGGHAGADGSSGSAGGGAIRVVASGTVAIDGVVLANGVNLNGSGAGAGGSIAITTSGLLTGGGRVEARGGNSGGGGGAIALSYGSTAGAVVTNARAEGGSDATGARGAAGTIYLKTAQSTFGELLVDGRGQTAGALTELPAVGATTAVSIAGNNSITTAARWLPPYAAGNAVRVTAPDGTVRGTWPIASITNDATARTIAGSATILTQDSGAYSGYLFYSPAGHPVYGANGTSFFAARYESGQWQYDTDSAFVNFTPAATDVVFGSFTKTANGISSVAKVACCAAINGVTSRDLAGGELLANSSGSASGLAVTDAGEIFVRADDAGRSIILSGGPAVVTLAAGATAVDVRVNDTLRGIYRFDRVTVKNANVATADLLASTSAPLLDASSSLVTGNLAAPAVTASLISFGKGLNGPIVTGQNGAAVDADGLVDVTVRNVSRTTGANTFTAAATATGSFSIAIEGAPGDVIVVTARDRHTFAMQSVEVPIGSIPADYGIASVTFNPATVMSGVSSTATVSLLGAAGSNGAQIVLTSSAPAIVATPATLVIPAGATSASFTVRSALVTAPQSVTVSASYAGVVTTGVLALEKDTVPPTATITKPLAGAVVKEASNATFEVEASVADGQSGVKSVTATFEAQSYPMTLSGSVYRAALPVPDVDGTALVAKAITVTAVDHSGNSVTSAPVSVQIEPLLDPNAPSINWSCPTGDAILPAGYTATLRVFAKGTSSTNGITTVRIVVNDGTTTSTLTASAVAGLADHYQASYAIPAALAEGTIVSARATATTQGNNSQSANTSFKVIRGDTTPITASTTLAINDTSYDNKTLIVYSTTATPTELTINGDHTFARVLVLDGGRITHANTTSSSVPTVKLVSTGMTYIGCGGAIDVTGRGYPADTSYPDETKPGNGSGGSHIGRGGLWSTSAVGSTFGSVYQPREAGGGAESQGSGGGVVRIESASVTLNGAIRANGESNNRGGAGGSIWIKSGRLNGNGVIEANGGASEYGSGGGGAVAIEYTDASSVLPVVRATSGTSNRSNFGGAGSIYIKHPQSTYGDLTVDNSTYSGHNTELPSLGSGIALATTAGPLLKTDRTTPIPQYFEGHWVEITNSSKQLKGTWRIKTVSGTAVTLEPNAGETLTLETGDRWQGVYRFDNLNLNGQAKLVSNDPIRSGATGGVATFNGSTGDAYTLLRTPVSFARVVINGNVRAHDITANELIVNNAAKLTPETLAPLYLKASILTVHGAIDATGRGYAADSTYPNETKPANGSGGSHIGRGGQFQSSAVGSTFGSIYQPREAGGGAESSGSGGGVVRIESATMTVNGAIRANGESNNRGGAGGSIWIKSGKISGSGVIEANGGTAEYGSGGGGAVAIEYTDASSVLPVVRATAGTSNRSHLAGAGSIYIKHPQSTYGDLTVDNSTYNGHNTELPSLGSGVALGTTAGPLLKTDRTTAIPQYFEGHWIEITSSSKQLKGTWRIKTVSGTSVTLQPNAGETLNLEQGDLWQGVYRFDNLTLNGQAKLVSNDPIRSGAAGGVATFNGSTGDAFTLLRTPVSFARVVINGNVRAQDITANELIVNNVAKLTPETLAPLNLKATTLTVNGAIDATGHGYAADTTYLNETKPANGSGGSHLGRGGQWSTSAVGSTFGSVYQPREAGAGAEARGSGGGVVRIESSTVTVNGAIRANGESTDRGGAGGSIWIKSGKISGSGVIEANGGTAEYGSGGGGAVAIEYTDASSVLPVVRATSGTSNRSNFGGAGSIYIKHPQSTYGDLTVDNSTYSGHNTELPSLGGGIALATTAGPLLKTDRTTPIPQYFEGHWVEITSSSKQLKGTWRIKTVSGTSVTLQPNAGETLNLEQGDLWQGVYRFDNLNLNGQAKLVSNDPIRSGAPGGVVTFNGSTGDAYTLLRTPVSFARVVVNGNVRAQDITADELIVNNAAKLTPETLAPFYLKATTLTVHGAIDATGRGYAADATYVDETKPGNGSGGSHIGRGGQWQSSAVGSTFGSIYQPREAGGGAESQGSGGGVIRIESATVTVNGAIRSNGQSIDRGGAGGSIWIKAGKISGSGVIEANGGTAEYGSGGGGAVAIEYTDSSSVLPVVRATAGTSNRSNVGGAGSVYVRHSQSTYGDLTVDNSTYNGQHTELPSLGSGTALFGSAGKTLVTDRATNVQDYFLGHWVEVTSASGASKGIWKIKPVAGSKTVELVPNGSETIAVVAGDIWRGVYRFDNLRIRGGIVRSVDRVIVTTAPDAETLSRLQSNDGPPQFNSALLSQIAVVSTASSDVVSGPANAVTDSSAPIILTATNVRTRQTFTANAAANGSFSVPVGGIGGDTFTLRATDSHAMPLSSGVVAVNGSLQDLNAVTAVAISSSSVSVGSTSTVTVRLALPARLGGVVVTLSSSAPAVASVAASVTVPAGSSSATATLTGTGAGNATITASTAAGSASGSVTVVAASANLVSVALSAATAEGGQTVIGTVTLGAAAPTGGAMVALSSSDAGAAQLPSSVVVAAGDSTATFTITTLRVAAASTIAVTAIYGETKSAALTLTPCASMTVATTPVTAPLATVWYDDALPTGAAATGDGATVTDQRASGTTAVRLAGAGAHSSVFTGAAPLAVNPADMLVVYALVNPCNPPRQISIAWTDGTGEVRANWGESVVEPTAPAVRMGAVPSSGQWVRLEMLARSLGVVATRSFTGLAIRTHGGEAWFDRVGTAVCALPQVQKPAYGRFEQVWFDDDVPPGAAAATSPAAAPVATWSSAQAASGTASLRLPAYSGLHQYSISALPARTFGTGSRLVTYVLLNPCNPPRELMLTWTANGQEYRAFWGDDLIETSIARTWTGGLPQAGVWTRLEVAVAAIGPASQSITGVTFKAYDGEVWFDRIAVEERVNLARHKPARQSSDFTAAEHAGRAVDGSLVSADGAMSVTRSEPNSWWEVDLGAVMPIDTIDVRGRTDCCAYQTGNFYLMISDAAFASNDLAASRAQAGVTSYYIAGDAGNVLDLRISRSGRYVRIQRANTHHLTLPEVEVWAPTTAARVNFAGGAKVSQSSNYDSWGVADFAVNGDFGSQYRVVGSYSATSNMAEAWWELDLGASRALSEIEIFNTPDAGAATQKNFYVLVSDTAITSKSLATAREQSGVSVFYFGNELFSSALLSLNRTARYVRVQHAASNHLQLGEVRAWSVASSLAPMLRTTPAVPPQADAQTSGSRQ